LAGRRRGGLLEDGVVDEPNIAYPRGDGEQTHARELRDRLEGLGIDQRDILGEDPGRAQRVKRRVLESLRGALPEPGERAGCLERLEQAARPGALVGIEQRVAAGHGHTVRLAHGGADLYANGEVEVLDQLPDDAMQSSFATTVVTPLKCPLPRAAPSSLSVMPITSTAVAKPGG